MDFRTQHGHIAALSTSDIYWHLRENRRAYGTQGVVLLCDRLLQRNEPIRGISIHFEALVRQLSTKRLAYIDCFPEAFSKAMTHVVLRELEKRGKSVSQWFWKHGNTQTGPLHLMQVEQRVEQGAMQNADLLWQEGWENWKQLSELDWLRRPMFFQQELPERKANGGTPIPPARPQASAVLPSSNSGLRITAGIITLVGAPIWLLVTVLTPFDSWKEPTGIFLPSAFALFMFLFAIPFGIGLLTRGYWAWWGRLVCAVLAIAWIGMKLAFYDGGIGWTFVLILELLVAAFLIAAQADFKNTTS